MSRSIAVVLVLGLWFAAQPLPAQSPATQRAGNPQAKLPPPTERDVKYGLYERNLLDFWQATSDQPTPVLVSIHGGGFRQGNKSVRADLLQDCLDAGISVAAITYRFSSEAIAPAPFDDCARAIQFIRSKAKDWNLDPKRMASTGGSAGAGLSLWLAFHDELADPHSADPVLRQSTRLSCVSVVEGQTSYDPRFIRTLFPEKDVYRIPPVGQLFGVDVEKLDELPAEKYKLFEEFSPINFLTKDDPPVQLVYFRPMNAEVTERNIGIHHPRFGKVLKEKMDGLNMPCELIAAGERIGGGKPTRVIVFLKDNFGMPVTDAERNFIPPPRSAGAAQGPSEQFRVWDRDHDGKLTRDEVPEAARGVFEKVDTNGDGFVSPEEDRTFRRQVTNQQP